MNALAELLQVERSTLLRHFRGKMRITPSAYLAQQRLQHALALLKQSRLPLSAIARASDSNVRIAAKPLLLRKSALTKKSARARVRIVRIAQPT